MIETFRSGDPLVAGVCASAFGNIGAQAVPQLLKALDDPSLRVWTFTAIDGLQSIPDPGEVLRKVESLIADPDPETRRGCVALLPRLVTSGAPIASIVSRLSEVLRADRDSDIRGEAANALGKIGDAAAAPALKRALKDKDVSVRQEARDALSQIAR